MLKNGQLFRCVRWSSWKNKWKRGNPFVLVWLIPVAFLRCFLVHTSHKFIHWLLQPYTRRTLLSSCWHRMRPTRISRAATTATSAVSATSGASAIPFQPTRTEAPLASKSRAHRVPIILYKGLMRNTARFASEMRRGREILNMKKVSCTIVHQRHYIHGCNRSSKVSNTFHMNCRIS
jgi:hypothetical protein